MPKVLIAGGGLAGLAAAAALGRDGWEVDHPAGDKQPAQIRKRCAVRRELLADVD
jgi:2-polyprenyl-6-methoxyphenol hydroxylase-like FAD-dependent oxidoreductase